MTYKINPINNHPAEGRGSSRLPDSNRVHFIDRTERVIKELRITPYELVHQGVTEMAASLNLDGLEELGDDLTWVNGQLEATGAAAIAPLPDMKLNPSALPGLMYGPGPLAEDGGGDRAYAVLTNNNRFAKLRIFWDAKDSKRKAQWFTYDVMNEPVEAGYGYRDPRDLLVAEEDGETVAYVSDTRSISTLPGSGNYGVVYRVPYVETYGSKRFENASQTQNTFLFASFTKLAAWNNPQQMALFQSRIFIVNNTVLARSNSSKGFDILVNDLDRATGLLLTADGSTAFITDMKEGGRLLRLKLNPSTMEVTESLTLLSNQGPTGYLSWADAEQSALYLPKHVPASVLRVENLYDKPSEVKTAQLVSSEDAQQKGLTTPWSVQVLSDREQLVISANQLGTVDNNLPLNPGELVLGIGLIPFNFIAQEGPNCGRANTTTEPKYFFQVNNVPFGGTLSLMLNHEGAHEAGARYYRVNVLREGTEPLLISNSFTDLKWDPDSARFVSKEAEIISDQYISRAFRVRSPDELWYNPFLAARIETTKLPPGLNQLEISFYDETGTLLVSDTKFLLIDNNRVSGSLKLLTIGGRQATITPCGVLHYESKSEELLLEYKPRHPTNDADYSLAFSRGGTSLAPLNEARNVAAAASPKTIAVEEITGACNIANVYIRLDVWARVTDGYKWINSTATALSFTLGPTTAALKRLA